MLFQGKDDGGLAVRIKNDEMLTLEAASEDSGQR